MSENRPPYHRPAPLLAVWILLVVWVRASAFAAPSGRDAPEADSTPAAANLSFPEASNAFAFRLYRALAPGCGGNLFFSPVGLETALGLVTSGARGATADDMKNAMGITLLDKPRTAAGNFLIGLASKDRAGDGHIFGQANALWTQQGHPFLPDFNQLAQERYHTAVESLDFARPENAMRIINGWVAEHTTQHIKDLIGPQALTEATRLVITNAVFFKAHWNGKFNWSTSHEAPFRVDTKDSQLVPLMNRQASYAYMEKPEFQVVRIPYRGSACSLIVFLPREDSSIVKLETLLSTELYSRITSALTERDVDVSLPRFSSRSNLELSAPLQALGMKRAFTERANFSGMTGDPAGLQISDVIHQAFAEVNEEEAESSAGSNSVPPGTTDSGKIPVFKADRPFWYVIQHDVSGAILFMGRLVNPKG